MKILTVKVDPTSGTVKIDINERVSKLHQDHYAYENSIISDCVIMGHEDLGKVKEERDNIYALPNLS